MNAMSVAESPVKSKSARFVPAVSEYDQGRELYKRGKSLEECVTDEMTQGWLDTEARCEAAYWRGMMRDGAAKFVNWNSGAEGAL